jgi:hypothetical protein
MEFRDRASLVSADIAVLCQCGNVLGVHDARNDGGSVTLRGRCNACGQEVVGRLDIFWHPPSLHQIAERLEGWMRLLRRKG